MSDEINKDEVIKVLKETVFYLGIVCPWQDGAKPEELMRMGTAINNAIKLLEKTNTVTVT